MSYMCYSSSRRNNYIPTIVGKQMLRQQKIVAMKSSRMNHSNEIILYMKVNYELNKSCNSTVTSFVFNFSLSHRLYNNVPLYVIQKVLRQSLPANVL